MLELQLFGMPRVVVDGEEKSLSGKARLLLAFLTLQNGRPLSNGAVAEAVFPDSEAEDPHDLVKKAASEIRRALAGEGRRLASPAPRRLALDVEGAGVDWRAFHDAIHRGDAESLQLAVALHSHPLLDMEPLSWAIPEQEACLLLRQAALETLCRSSLEGGPRLRPRLHLADAPV